MMLQSKLYIKWPWQKITNSAPHLAGHLCSDTTESDYSRPSSFLWGVGVELFPLFVYLPGNKGKIFIYI